MCFVDWHSLRNSIIDIFQEMVGVLQERRDINVAELLCRERNTLW